MIRCLVASLLVCRAAFAAAVPWVNLGPGGGGWIMSVAASPHDRNVVIAGGDIEGVFLSQDGGQTWTPRNTGLHDSWVEAILSHPTDSQTIFIAGKSGVYKSTDGAQTWTWLRNGFPPVAQFSYTAPVGSLVADPSAPATIYAGIGSQRDGIGAQGAIYKTTDGGDHWIKVNKSGLPDDALITAMVIHPTDTSHLYVSSNKGVYESLDSGVSWAALNAGLPHTDVRYLVISRSNPKVLYLTLRTPLSLPWRGGVYKSSDGGRNWVSLNNSLGKVTSSIADPHLWSQYYRLAIDPADDRVVYAGTTDYVTHTLYRSADGGTTWLPIITKPPSATFDRGWNTAFGETVECLAMSPLDSKLLFFGNGMHIYKTPDAGASWQQLFTRPVGNNWQTNGLEITQPWMVAVDPRNSSRLFFGYADIGLWVSEDGGRSFLGYHMPARETIDGTAEDVFAYAVALDPSDPKHLWAMLQEAGNVYESRDGSVTWTMLSTGLPPAELGRLERQLLFDSQTRRLLANVDGKNIYASDNGGLSWSPSSAGLPSDPRIRDLVASPSEAGVYYCLLAGNGLTPARVYRSTDRGTTWTLVSGSTLRAHNVFPLVVSAKDPQRMYLAARQRTANGVNFPGGIFASADGGATWTLVLSDPYAYAVAADPADAGVVYAGLRDDPFHDESRGGGLKLSTDGGATWTPIDDTLPSQCIWNIAVDPADHTRVYVGTCGNGVFRLDLSAPIITKVANAFGEAPLIAPNTWVYIQGLNLAPAGDARIWLDKDFASGQLPAELDGVSATVNGKSAYIYYISPTQINMLTPPDSLTNPTPVQVTVEGVRSNIATVPAQVLSLSFFEFVSSDRKHYVYGRHANGELIGPPGLFPSAPNFITPVKPGEAIYIAATGFGPTNVPVVSGSISQSGTLPTPLPVVKVGNIQANVSFAGLVGVGTYQINFVVPPNAPDGDLALSATYQGLTIQSGLLITVKH